MNKRRFAYRPGTAYWREKPATAKYVWTKKAQKAARKDQRK